MALKRSLGLTLLTFYGTGMILGAGIYSIIGQAAGKAALQDSIFSMQQSKGNHFNETSSNAS